MFSFRRCFSFLGLLLLCSVVSSTLQASELEMSDARLSVFLNPAGPPFAFLKEDLSIMHGVDVDIILEMRKRLGFEFIDNRMYPLEVAQASILKDKKTIDLYGGGMPYKSEYVKMFAPLPIYIKSSLGVLYSEKIHTDIKSTKDLKGLKVGVAPNSASIGFVQKFGAEPVEITNLSYAVFKVLHGELDALIYDRIVLKDFAKSTQNASFKILDEEFGKEHCQYTFYISKLSPYRKALTTTLQDMLNDGTVNKILGSWGIEVKKPVFKRRATKKK